MGRNTSEKNHGYFGTRAYDAWLRMRNGCYREIDPRYPALGGSSATLSELAREYGSTQGYKSRICSTKRWRQFE